MKRIGFLNRIAATKWRKDESGSFTLEAVFVFPVLLAMVLVFLLLGMYLYQKVIVYYSASVTTERAAYSWDNSHREPTSGILLKLQYDGLYRRLGKDGQLASLFGIKNGGESMSVELPETSGNGSGHGSSSLIKQKLSQSAAWIPASSLPYAGRIAYARDGLGHYVEIILRKPIELFPWEGSWIKRPPEATAKGFIVDPVEFIRSVDLVRYYSAKFMNHPLGKTTAKAKAGKVLSSHGEKNNGGE